MRKVLLALVLLVFSTSRIVQAGGLNSCKDLEKIAATPNFASKMQWTPYDKAKETKLAQQQAAATVKILKARKVDMDKKIYLYVLKISKHTYDAVHVDLGTHRATIVFIKGTYLPANFYFLDGEVYFGQDHCNKIRMPGDIQF